MAPTPSMPGFVEAQWRLIDQTGADVVFRARQRAQWAPDVQRDPQTGEPYDPTAVPVVPEGWAEVTVRAAKVQALISRRGADEVDANAGGIMRASTSALAVKASDYDAVKDADEAVLGGERWRITDIVGDQVNGGVYRYVIYLEGLA